MDHALPEIKREEEVCRMRRGEFDGDGAGLELKLSSDGSAECR